MRFDIKEFSWVNEPKVYDVKPECVSITTEAETDLWQKTFYHGEADNAPMLLMSTGEKRFSFSVKAEMKGDFGAYDQCGLMIYQDSDNWLKVSCEYENSETQHLGSVHTTHGYSDWATTSISAEYKKVWYRLSRKDDDYLVETSLDGKNYSLMRMFHMFEGGGEIRVGIYACSPDESSFTAEFSEFKLEDFDADSF